MNQFEPIKNNLKQSKDLISQYGDTEIIYNELLNKLENPKLSILVFGAYNAGKSLFINTLLGKEVTKVADVPTTDKVEIYNWNDIEIIDSPGINAPISHTQITEKEIERTSTILFVIRQGEQDSKAIYNKIFEFIEKKKKIFIILNHESIAKSDVSDSIRNINEHLLAFADSKNIVIDKIKEINLLPINILTAFNAKINNSSKNLDHSGWPDFISSFEIWLQKNNLSEVFYDNFKNEISERWYLPVIKNLENLIKTNNNSSKLIEKQKNINFLELKQNSLMNKASVEILNEINKNKSNIIRILENSNDQNKLEEYCNTLFKSIYSTVSELLEIEFNNISTPPGMNVSNLNINTLENNFLNNTGTTSFDYIKDILTDKNVIQTGLQVAQKYKIISKIPKTQLPKLVTKINAFLVVATSALTLISKNKMANEENKAAKLKAIQISQTTDDICNSISKQLNIEFKNNIQQSFETTFDSLKTDIKNVTDTNSKHQNDYNSICQYRETLNSI